MGEPVATQPYLTQIVHRGARTRPDQVCLVSGARITSFGAFADHVARLGGAIRQRALPDGGCVAILAANSDRYVEAMFATMWAGATFCPLNVRWTVDDIVAALEDCCATALFVDHTCARLLTPILDRLSSLRIVIAMDELDADVCAGLSVVPWEDLLSGPAVLDAGRSGDDVALVLFTGGTTGASKGVLLTHANLMLASLSMLAAGCGTGPVYLHAPPLFHIAGVQVMLGHFLGGIGRHVIVPSFEPGVILSAIEAHQVTDVMLVPTMLQMVLAHPDMGGRNLTSLKRIFYGAAPMTDTLLRTAMEAIPGVGFVQGYGMTETALTVMLPPWYYTPEGLAEQRTGSIGRPLPTADVVIRDLSGAEVPRHTVGELTVKSPSVMLGYLGRPEETAATLRDGWLYSGDGAYMDEDGFIYLTDRIKDMIITGGENVYSIEVEAVLVTHPDVATAAVIGIPHPSWGEQVHAVVTVVKGAHVDAGELITYCRERLAGYKCPRSVEFRDLLPCSAAGKVLKGTLRSEYRAGSAASTTGSTGSLPK